MSLQTSSGGIWDRSATVLYNVKYNFEFNTGKFKLPIMVEVTDTDSRKNGQGLIEDKFKYLTNNSPNAIINTKKTLYIVYATQSHSDPMGQSLEIFVK